MVRSGSVIEFRNDATDGGNPDGGGAADPGTSGGDPWYSSLPDHLRGDADITKYTSLEQFATGYKNQSKMIGRPADSLLETPKDAEGRLALFRKLGAPEAADGYTLAPVEGLDESLAPTGAMAKLFVAAAAKHGLLPDQAQGIYAEVAQQLGATMAQQDEATASELQKGLADLQTKWGAAYDQKVAAVRYGVEKIGGDALKNRFEHYGLENDPVFAEAFAKVGELLAKEDTAGNPATGASRFGSAMTPAEAQAKGEGLLQEALRTKDMHERKRLNIEAQKYFQLAYPEDG